ncbi:MAG: tol-pal system protein YbgF [Candidatus Rokubacteria bacterium]|nr:tol-pal system protein YbgF [Candidatus Rokubacteria bacterium]
MQARLVVLLMVTVSIQACATRGQVRALRGELANLNVAVRDLQGRQLSITDQDAIRNELRTLGAQALALETRMADTAVQVGRLDARLAATERATREDRAALDEVRKAIDQLTPPPPSPPSAAPSAPALPRPGPPRAAPPPADAPSRAAPPPRSTQSPEQVYAAALGTFRAREHGQAVLEFLDFIGRFPKHPLAGNAQYWIGEAYYVQRDYRQAIAEFEKVFDHGARHRKVPDALLKIGMSHRALREVAKAADVWRRLVRDHPKSDAAAKAREFLRAPSSPPAR